MGYCSKHNRSWKDDEERDEEFGCPDCEREGRNSEMVEDNGIFTRVREIMKDEVGVTVTQQMKFQDDLHMDYLDMTELIMEVEEEFDIHISDEEIKKLLPKTVADLVETIAEMEN